MPRPVAEQALFHYPGSGCMRTWCQTEEPPTEQFAMDKEKFAIQFFQFLMTVNRFFGMVA